MREKHRPEASAIEEPMSQELRSKEGNERESGGASRRHLRTPSDTKTPRDLVQTCSVLAKLQVQVQGRDRAVTLQGKCRVLPVLRSQSP